MGLGDAKILAELPTRFTPSNILFVGLRNWEREEIKERQKQYGIKHLTPIDVAQNSDAIKAWLKSCGATKVVIHFDMDVLDPAETIAGCWYRPRWDENGRSHSGNKGHCCRKRISRPDNCGTHASHGNQDQKYVTSITPITIKDKPQNFISK